MSVTFDVKDHRGNIVSTLTIDDNSLTEFGKIYNNCYFEGLEEIFGCVHIERRDDSIPKVIFKQRF